MVFIVKTCVFSLYKFSLKKNSLLTSHLEIFQRNHFKMYIIQYLHFCSHCFTAGTFTTGNYICLFYFPLQIWSLTNRWAQVSWMKMYVTGSMRHWWNSITIRIRRNSPTVYPLFDHLLTLARNSQNQILWTKMVSVSLLCSLYLL